MDTAIDSSLFPEIKIDVHVYERTHVTSLWYRRFDKIFTKIARFERLEVLILDNLWTLD